MTVTKAILREQIRRILSGGNPSDRDRTRDAEIDLAISDVANQLLKSEAVNTLNAQGLPNVDGLAVVTYENIPVSRGTNWGQTKTSVVTLPVTPMMLENGQGIQNVYPSGYPNILYRYIPDGLFASWTKSRYVAPLHKTLYTYSGKKITIFDDLFSAGYSTVDIKLVVSDISQADENDPLPILPEHRDMIIGAVVQRFMGESDTNRRETDQLSPSKRN